MTDAFFVQRGDRLEPTEQGIGPWSPDALHGGPPSALLARAITKCDLDPGWHVARINVELLRPVPRAPLRVTAEVIRPGRTTQRISATMIGEDGKEIARALALRIKAEDVADVPSPVVDDPPRPPEVCDPFVFPFFQVPVGYHTAMELRLERGTFWKTPVRMWMRPRVVLIAGEALSPLERVMICADSGNGVSPILATERFTFVNPDLDVHLHRMPRGEWICLDAQTIAQAQGVGMADTRLWDEHGPIGRGVQMLVVRHR